MSYNPKSLFNKIQQKEQANVANGGGSQGFSNPLIFKPKVGTTYSVRLLWLNPTEDSDREYPMINSYIHRVWDDNATNGNKDNKIVCPTSQYMLGETSAGFKRCPICEAASDFYRKGQEGSESAKELYKKFRRTCVGYVPIYIVNGPEEDINQIRILQYGKQFKDFFDQKIFGLPPKGKNNEEVDLSMMEEAIGVDAFMFVDAETNTVMTNGYNLIITTTSKKMFLDGKQVDMPQYSLDFARKATNISDIDGVELDSPAGIKYFNSLNSQVLHFDSDFYIKSTDEELHDFKLNFITKETISNESVDEDVMVDVPKRPVIKPVARKPIVESSTEEIDEIPMGDAPKNKLPVIDEDVEEPVVTKKTVKKPVVIDDDDAMIDDLLAGIQ